MSQDRERQVRLGFLEEAQEHIDTIESGLLGISANGIRGQQLDAFLRGAHTIKGGAAMMGYGLLSDLAHRLEDSFKVIKVRPNSVTQEVERLLLSAIAHLQQLVALSRQEMPLEETWLDVTVNPVFDRLREILGEPQAEDTAALLSVEAEMDMTVLLFQSEVEECLLRLESVLANPESSCLSEEFSIAAQELAGLGEMLELPAFTSLCQSINEHLETGGDTRAIAQAAIEVWRRSQALVLIGQKQVLPTQLDLITTEPPKVLVSPDTIESQAAILPELADLTSFEADLASFDLAEAVDAFLEVASLPQEEVEQLPELADLTSFEVDSFDVAEAVDAFLDLKELPEDAVEFFASLNSLALGEQQSEAAEEPLTPAPVVFTPSAPKAKSQALPEARKAEDTTIRIPVSQLSQLSDLFGELLVERNGLSLQLTSLRNLSVLLQQRVRVLEQSNFRLRTAYDKVAVSAVSPFAVTTDGAKIHGNADSDKGISVNTSGLSSQFDLLEMDRYSDLHLLSQEVMETVVQIQEVTDDLEIQLTETENMSRELERTSKFMQSNFIQMRMRPLSDLVGRFSRALRDMSLQYGKQVELKIKGETTLIDRSALEALREPMLHLIRNAFDHGIEDPATRKASGKPEQGTIEVAALGRGNQTVITVRDDGRGINLDRIRAKALSMGLDEDELARTSEGELLALIFEPGFSTAEKVTDLSGRGVGMDVVRTKIEEVRGQVQVSTKPGQGTTFTVILPSTLSAMRVLLVESNGMLMAFPSNVVEEVMLFKPEMIDRTAGQEVLNWEGYLISLIHVSEWLQFSRPRITSNPEVAPAIDQPTVLMIAQEDNLVALKVDRYWGEQEVTVRQIEGGLPMPSGFSGCTIMGDGQVVPLVEASSLISWIEKQLSQRSETERQQPQPAASKSDSMSKNTVMVVDDSINVRRFLAMTLEKAGYRVEQAKDGLDAVAKLQANASIQAVVCDVEMPRLDGFGFLAQVKTNSTYKQLPVIMLTSRSGSKHRQMAMHLGATAYFTKPFKEQQLLDTLQELTTQQLLPV